MTKTNLSDRVYIGDILSLYTRLPIAQAIVTSPPYWGLRWYPIADSIFGGDPNCDHTFVKMPPPRPRKMKDGQQTHSNYEAKPSHLCTKCGQWRGQLGMEPHPQMYVEHLADILVSLPLAKNGVMFVNIKDTHIAGSGKKGLLPKNLAVIPGRLAIAMQERGWIFRQEIIWHKNGGAPEAVKDRLSISTERILMFVRSRIYKFNRNAILVPCKTSSIRREHYGYSASNKWNVMADVFGRQGLSRPRKTGERTEEELPQWAKDGKRPIRDVWTMETATGEASGDHVAPMPLKMAHRCIALATDFGDLVLDPFGGSGTTAIAAMQLGREWAVVDIDPKLPARLREKMKHHMPSAPLI